MYNFKISDELPYRVVKKRLVMEQENELCTIYPAIIFVTESSISIAMDGLDEQKTIARGHLFLLPPAILCSLSPTETSDILCLEVPDMPFLYMNLFSCPLKVDQVNIQQLFSPVEIVGSMVDFVSSLDLYLQEKLTAPYLMGLKAMEFFVFLKHYYPIEQIHKFFSPILLEDYKFALFVLTHYQQVSSSKELSALSNYSYAHFDRRFRKIFKQPPYQWMLQKKIHNIYAEVKNTSKPLKLIADQYGFASVANFGDFCRKHFGVAPSYLRREIKR